MSKALTIQLSNELEEKLLIQSKKLNLSLEELILQSLTKSIKLIDSYEDDPILPLLGTLRFENSDIGKNHDNYLRENLQQELKVDK
ncbi:MAG: hypothetical protein HEQ27_15270 [Dolichospermum sp. JUN01]|jgi:hypothetical protein|nr:hypothetical protein [Dolichospermum sp. JUN01]MBS3028214.1 hypothetical protein [Dolichospermum sp. DET66]MBS3033413.1 hypothetical protein [Dolichospermum sp. DET67]MBS3038617.1 hypothetical protein [Dolichospermum sp. DET50]QSV53040.1 MAG: hypothetical protein HEP80_03060 [Dolichospermum sp. UKL201]QSV63632.1 MAG: hypothetical protein HEQ26_13610 [Dolichospermum sp. DL01]QSX65899.1 MAG: hypothetical protein EZY12_13570 [Dolichospermum sp. DET69]